MILFWPLVHIVAATALKPLLLRLKGFVIPATGQGLGYCGRSALVFLSKAVVELVPHPESAAPRRAVFWLLMSSPPRVLFLQSLDSPHHSMLELLMSASFFVVSKAVTSILLSTSAGRGHQLVHRLRAFRAICIISSPSAVAQ